MQIVYTGLRFFRPWKLMPKCFVINTAKRVTGFSKLKRNYNNKTGKKMPAKSYIYINKM